MLEDSQTGKYSYSMRGLEFSFIINLSKCACCLVSMALEGKIILLSNPCRMDVKVYGNDAWAGSAVMNLLLFCCFLPRPVNRWNVKFLLNNYKRQLTKNMLIYFLVQELGFLFFPLLFSSGHISWQKAVEKHLKHECALHRFLYICLQQGSACASWHCMQLCQFCYFYVNTCNNYLIYYDNGR